MDTTSGTVLANDELADGPDVLAYDDGRKLLFIAAESSAVDVFDISGSTPQHLARRTFIGGAHTIALDPSTNRMYLPLAQGTSGPELLVIEIQV